MVYCKSPSSKNKLFQCLFPNQTNPEQNCGFECKSQVLLFDHLGNDHSLVDLHLRLVDDISTVNGTAPVTDKVPSKCNNCGKRFANKMALKIHRAAEQKELVDIKKDSSEMRCGYNNCNHTAKFSDEEIIRHFGLFHLNLNKPKSKSQLLEPRPNTVSQTGHLVPYIAPLEVTAEQEITEVPVPKKEIEVIDLDLDDEEEEIAASAKKLEKEASSPIKKSSLTCPVCNGPFQLLASLHHHLSSTHFQARLTALVPALQDKGFSCPDSLCSFAHISRKAVVDHISASHFIAFDIASKLFPDFTVPSSQVSTTEVSSKVPSSPIPTTINASSKGKKRTSSDSAGPSKAKRIRN